MCGSPPISLIADYSFALLVLACLFGFFMAWGAGANGVANAMGASMGPWALTVRQAILMAVVFEFCGAYFAGDEVAKTIRNGIADSQYMTPRLLVFGMLSVSLAVGIWLLLAMIKGRPMSTIHFIVDAIIDFTSISVSMHTVHQGVISPIVASWMVTPVLSGLFVFALFRDVQWPVLYAEGLLRSARRYVLLYIFLVGLTVALMTAGKDLKHVDLELPDIQTLGSMLLTGGLMMGLGIALLLCIRPIGGVDPRDGFVNAGRVFAVLVIFTTCSMASAHDADDVANAIGPVAVIAAVVQAGGDLELVTRSPVSPWVLLLGVMGIVVGLATYGYRVTAIIDQKITELTLNRGFTAKLATTSTAVSASVIGLPVSTTHALVGVVLGIDMTHDIGVLNLRVIGSIPLSWIVTLPVGALLAILLFLALRTLFGAWARPSPADAGGTGTDGSVHCRGRSRWGSICVESSMPLSSLKDRFGTLIAASSVSYAQPELDQTNCLVVGLLASRLSGLGFRCEIREVSSGKFNLLVSYDSGPGGLVLVDHTDTVPCDGALWSGDLLRPSRCDGRWYDLGDCGMRGFLPPAVEALLLLPDRPFCQPLMILAVCDEESSMADARALVESERPLSHATVIDEPINLRPIRLHKGVMMKCIEILEQSGHSSNPNLGRSALETMHATIDELVALRGKWQQA